MHDFYSLTGTDKAKGEKNSPDPISSTWKRMSSWQLFQMLQEDL